MTDYSHNFSNAQTRAMVANMKLSGSTRAVVIIISGIMALVATLIFVVLRTTALSMAAYIFALFGIGAFAWGSLYMLDNSKRPWFVVFPKMIWIYLSLQVTVSAIFLIPENLFGTTLPLILFLVAQAILATVFAVYLLILKAGTDTIQQRDAEVKQKVSTLRLMQTDIESLCHKFPGHEADLKKVAEALRYSDPMTNQSLAHYDDQIQRIIFSISTPTGNEAAKVPDQCAEILRLIADRNSRVKLMK